jgi:hypothetical protein
LQKEGYNVIVSFLRKSYKEFDNTLSIHADTILFGKDVSLASVLYINESENVTKNGTAFYSHKKYGESLPSVSIEEHDKMLIEDAKDPDKWEQLEIVWSSPNRLLEYNGKNFHSRHPTVIEEGVRIVVVTFYEKQ